MNWTDVAKDTSLLLSRFQGMPVKEQELEQLCDDFMKPGDGNTYKIVSDPINYVKLCAYVKVKEGKIPETMRNLVMQTIMMSFTAMSIDEDLYNTLSGEELYAVVKLAMQILTEQDTLSVSSLSLGKN